MESYLNSEDLFLKAEIASLLAEVTRIFVENSSETATAVMSQNTHSALGSYTESHTTFF